MIQSNKETIEKYKINRFQSLKYDTIYILNFYC